MFEEEEGLIGNGRMKWKKRKRKAKNQESIEERDGDRRPDVPRGKFPVDEGWARFPQHYMPVCV